MEIENEKMNISAKDDYMRAAKILASCSPERLPIVLDMLKKAGLEIDEVESKKLIVFNKRGEMLKEKRQYTDRSKWLDSDDPFVLYLREAYEDGISFKDVVNITGLNKSTVYRILWGEKMGTDFTRNLIYNAIEQIRNENSEDDENQDT